MSIPIQHSSLLATMPEGIGNLTFFSPEWIDVARASLTDHVGKYAASLADLDSFRICEVAHNPPAYLRCGNKLAWHATFRGSSFEIATGELPADQCHYKVEGDHSIMSLAGRIRYAGSDPTRVAAALARLRAVGHWKIHGAMSSHPALGAVLGFMHDDLAPRTMPRFVLMTPEWVSIARSILTTRAHSSKCAAALRNIRFTLFEEFTHPPRYAVPEDSTSSFWMLFDHGRLTIGTGALPEELQPADRTTRGMYIPLVPIGRSFLAGMSKQELEEMEAYGKRALGYQVPGETTFEQSGSEIPAAVGAVFATLHDEMVKRTSGELPSDFLTKDLPGPWAEQPSFDRDPMWERSWVRYDEVDIYGAPL